MSHTSIAIRFWRLLRLFLWTIKMIGLCRMRYPFLAQNMRDQYTCRLARQVMQILHVRIETAGSIPDHAGHMLFVANHVSWLDITALLSLYPMSFVAKKEIRSWFLIGKVVERVGSIFVDRTRRKDTEHINQLIAEKLDSGSNVAFFPEARTSEDGLRVRPFKAALLESAFLSHSDICPVVIRYYDGDNRRTHLPAYTDNVSLFGCVCNILSLRETVVRLDFLDRISADTVASQDRFVLKDQIEEDIKKIAESDMSL